jgi:hypothetical protein
MNTLLPRLRRSFLASLLAAAAVLVSPAAAQPAEKPAPDQPADTKRPDKKPKDTLANRQITGRATRVAILDFGPPVSWGDLVGGTVGITVTAKSFKEVIPMLEADKADVVVIRINSGGGLLDEMKPFQELFQFEYEPRFRTVAWVHSAISCAAMSPWPLDEFYMEPEGNIGACTAYSGPLVAMKDEPLLNVLENMRIASEWGGRDPKIMRSMQIQEPLSANVDEFGNVTFFQDSTSGKIRLNPDGQILTLNAIDAVRVKFARGIASNTEELMKLMNITEYEIVGQKATRHIQNTLRRNHDIDKAVGKTTIEYKLAVGAALSLSGENNREQRAAEVGRARRALAVIKKQCELNRNFRYSLSDYFDGQNLNEEWFENQEYNLKRIAEGR